MFFYLIIQFYLESGLRKALNFLEAFPRKISDNLKLSP